MGIRLDAVSLARGRFTLSDVTFEVRPREFFCLLGPSGSGKSSLLGCVGGWLPPSAGTVFIGETDCTGVSPFLRPVRTCFQGAGLLFPHLTVFENIAYSLRVKGVKEPVLRERVCQLLDRIHLSAQQRRRPHDLSGGEAQRVAIARALADPQPVLLLDEVQASLDRHLRAAIRELLVDTVVERNLTAIYVTHDASEALGLASRLDSRLGILAHGRLQQIGSAHDIYGHPATSFVASLLGDMNLISVSPDTDGVYKTLDGVPIGRPPAGVAAPRYLGFRPEAVWFSPREGEHVTLDCTAIGVEFLGSTTHVRLRSASSTLLARSSKGGPPLPVGSIAKAYVSMRDVVWLAE